MKCPICTSKTASFVDVKPRMVYHACPKCDYIFKSPEHHPDLFGQKERYDLHENDPDDPGYRAYFQRFLDFILPQVPVGGRALDFGSGASDLLASMLTEAGYTADRYDPIYYPDSAYASQNYALIVSTEVFEHLDDPLTTLSYLRDRLASGGHLALQTQFLPETREAFLEWYYRLDPTHIGFFTPRTFAVMGERLRLQVAGEDGINKVVMH